MSEFRSNINLRKHRIRNFDLELKMAKKLKKKLKQHFQVEPGYRGGVRGRGI
jgi:hypothetical protein